MLDKGSVVQAPDNTETIRPQAALENALSLLDAACSFLVAKMNQLLANVVEAPSDGGIVRRQSVSLDFESLLLKRQRFSMASLQVKLPTEGLKALGILQ
jgi:hypothetical protein